MPRLDAPDPRYPTMKHNFKWARITKLYPSEDTADIEILNKDDQPTGEIYNQVPIFFHCKPDSELRSNGALNGAASAFEEGDIVIVRFENGSPLVVGGREKKRECKRKKLLVFFPKSPISQDPHGRYSMTTPEGFELWEIELKAGNPVLAKKLGDLPLNTELPPKYGYWEYYFQYVWLFSGNIDNKSLDYPNPEEASEHFPWVPPGFVNGDLPLKDQNVNINEEDLPFMVFPSPLLETFPNYSGYINGIRFFIIQTQPYFTYLDNGILRSVRNISWIWIQGEGWKPWGGSWEYRDLSGDRAWLYQTFMDYDPDQKKLTFYHWCLRCGERGSDWMLFVKLVYDTSTYGKWIRKEDESRHQFYWGDCKPYRPNSLTEEDWAGRLYFRYPVPDWFSPPGGFVFSFNPFTGRRERFYGIGDGGFGTPVTERIKQEFPNGVTSDLYTETLYPQFTDVECNTNCYDAQGGYCVEPVEGWDPLIVRICCSNCRTASSVEIKDSGRFSPTYFVIGDFFIPPVPSKYSLWTGTIGRVAYHQLYSTACGMEEPPNCFCTVDFEQHCGEPIDEVIIEEWNYKLFYFATPSVIHRVFPNPYPSGIKRSFSPYLFFSIGEEKEEDNFVLLIIREGYLGSSRLSFSFLYHLRDSSYEWDLESKIREVLESSGKDPESIIFIC